jgi:hypothetical protein
MALIEEFDRSGNWLFRWRSFLPLVLYVLAALVILFEADVHLPAFDATWAWLCIAQALSPCLTGQTQTSPMQSQALQASRAEVVSERKPLWLCGLDYDFDTPSHIVKYRRTASVGHVRHTHCPRQSAPSSTWPQRSQRKPNGLRHLEEHDIYIWQELGTMI